MRSELKVSGMWIGGAILLWGIDVLTDPCFMKMPLKTHLLCSSTSHAIFMRSYMLTAFLLFAVVSYFLVRRQNAARQALHEAQDRISKLTSHDTLSGLLPICSYCKRIRDNAGRWIKIETYIEQRSNAEFTHGICPDCEKKI
ncbi:MAG: hypothetical protein HZB82_03880 [Deltaproteobacteria bacterium]|nr:hypothetical protein [Deltaproteobacteria bacterium]